jgi:hypothetical protein
MPDLHFDSLSGSAPLDVATFDQLLSPLGQRALAAASDPPPTDANYLAGITRLRKHFPAELARAALDTALLRRKAVTKFSRADRMYFTREALEVSSGEVIARHRAQRFKRFGTAGDFGCGIGGDAIGLTDEGVRVEAVDRDELRVRMTETNLGACERGHLGRARVADLLTDQLPDVPAAYADPGRRSGSQRFLSLADYLPPPGELLKRLPGGFPIAFKLAPGVAWSDLSAFDGEVEFVSVDGELKECVLWLGELRTTRRRATLLRSGGSGSAVTLTTDAPAHPAEPRPITAYLYDPAAAVTRADLVTTLAEQCGLQPVDGIVQLLTADTLTPTPFATAYRVDAVLPFDSRSVLAELRRRNVGRVTVVNRGSLADVERSVGKWKLAGEDHRFVILSRQLGKQVAVIGDRV